MDSTGNSGKGEQERSHDLPDVEGLAHDRKKAGELGPPAEVTEFCRLLARVLRRKGSNNSIDGFPLDDGTESKDNPND